MKKRIFKISGIILLIFALVANLQYASLHYDIKEISLGAPVFGQSGTSGGSSSGGSSSGGSCWKTVEVFCSSSVTNTTGTSSGGTGPTVTTTVSFDKDGNVMPGASTDIIGWLFRKKTVKTNTTTTVTKYRADCESGGNNGCQPANCEGASVGTYKDCTSGSN